MPSALACRMLSEIEADPSYWRKRLAACLVEPEASESKVRAKTGTRKRIASRRRRTTILGRPRNPSEARILGPCYPEKPRDQHLKLTASLCRVELALLVDQENGGQRMADPPEFGEIVRWFSGHPEVRVVPQVELRPGDSSLLHELLECIEAAVLLGRVEADANDLDSSVVICVVQPPHLAHVAPGGPEIHDNDLSTQVFHRDVLTQ